MIRGYYFLLFALLSIIGVNAQDKPISLAEADATGKQLAIEVNAGNATKLFAFVDSVTFYNKVKAGSEIARMHGFMEGFLGSFSLQRFAGPVQEAVNNGSFRYLRSYEKNGSSHLLFRLMPGLGVNYYDFTLIRINNSIKASDLLFYISGEDMSVSIIHLIDAMAGSVSDESDLNNLKSIISDMSKLKAQGNWAGVKTAYNKLDNSFRHDRTVAMLNVMACQHLDKASYKKALEQFARDFPTTSSVPLLLIDMYALNGEFGRALNAIDQLDSFTGGDPALDYVRANQYVNLQQPDSALNCWLRVYAYDPSLPNNIKKLVAYYYQNNQKDKASNVLRTYQQTAGARQEFVAGLKKEMPDLE